MSSIQTRVHAGITVPHTPLITKALAYARLHLNDLAYNHVLRSWLFGTYIADNIPDLHDRDIELHSVAAILHDLGWSTTAGFISKDKRFEVDGANAAREFLKKEGGAAWDKHRLQLAWDAIALHDNPSIATEKEVEVRTCHLGIAADFLGPERSYGGVLTRDIWDGIVKEYPRSGFKDGVKKTMCHLCMTKPDTTYDNIVGDFGENYLDGYSREGRLFVDLVEATEG